MAKAVEFVLDPTSILFWQECPLVDTK
jgi:hypothetical protein